MSSGGRCLYCLTEKHMEIRLDLKNSTYENNSGKELFPQEFKKYIYKYIIQIHTIQINPSQSGSSGPSFHTSALKDPISFLKVSLKYHNSSGAEIPSQMLLKTEPVSFIWSEQTDQKSVFLSSSQRHQRRFF